MSRRTTLVLVALACAAAVATVLCWEHGRRAFWTCAIAALPLVWVTIGFHAWRRLCPLAALSRMGALLGREGPRRPPAALVRWAPLVQLALMIAALTLRHVCTNGDRVALAAFLVALGGAAVLVGLRWSGRTWCHVACPVGLVERIYTEPGAASGAGASTSACAPCTGCVSRCPDLDLQRSHRAGLDDRARVVAWTAWPGVVLAFYVFFFIEAGTWDAYFSGAWAYDEAPSTAWRAGLVLMAGGAASAALLLALEWSARRLGADAALTRHRTLVASGALGFGLFYVFAGQPTLLVAPRWVWLAAAVAVVLAAARLLATRWSAAPGPARVRGRRLPLVAAR